MKKVLFGFVGLLLATMVFVNEKECDEMRGVWIASVYQIDFPSRAGLSEGKMREELDEIVEYVAEIGGNAIFFQVRPSADGLYASEIVPWSSWLSGVQGKAPDGAFDPLRYLIEKGKEYDIEVHAWLNPYKVLRGTADAPNYDLSQLSEDNPLLKQKDLLVFCNGEVYMDPGRRESRELVLDVVEELVCKYEIAGIHYDDYFYPAGDFDDGESYGAYCMGAEEPLSREDWRRENINCLVRETYGLVKGLDKDMVFGISPAGVWANRSDRMVEGSDTWMGMQTYFEHYADSRLWVKEGWVDYIAPQIYWNVGYEGCDYEVLVKWWSEVCEGEDVELYIGQALYKLGDDGQSDAWLDGAEILRQMDVNDKYGADGCIFYGYEKIEENFLGIRDILRERE